jgi:hypothetical protein
VSDAKQPAPRERDVEQELCKEVLRRKGKSFKWASPSHRGVPDRIVFLPEGLVAAIEVKAKGKKPTKLQLAVHDQLRGLGAKVYVVDDCESIKGALDALST